MEAAFGRLHNSGGPPSAAPHCCGFHNGGWGDKWLEKVDETLLKHVAIVSKTFHQLHPAIYYFLEEISTVLVLEWGGKTSRTVDYSSPGGGGRGFQIPVL